MDGGFRSILSIGGSDPVGGAGVQADVRTASLLGVYAAAAVSCVTVQNSRGVTDVVAVGPDLLSSQIKAVFDDFIPDAVKIGMLPDAASIRAVVNTFTLLLSRSKSRPRIIVDPILAPTSGKTASHADNEQFIDNMLELVGMSDLVTPNIPEFQILCNSRLGTILPPDFKTGSSEDDMLEVGAICFVRYYMCTSLLLKGGHAKGDCCDNRLFSVGSNQSVSVESFPSPKIQTRNTHGSGCVLSTAIACNLAKGMDMKSAVAEATGFVAKALEYGRNISFGAGYGPTLFPPGSKTDGPAPPNSCHT